MRLPDYLVATWILALTACPPARPPVPPPIDPTIYTADCLAIYQQELGRAPDPGGLTNCLQIIVQAKQAGAAIPQEAFRAFVRASDEWKARQAAQQEVVLPRLIPHGSFLRQETGARFTVIDATDFSLFSLFMEGRDITPILKQREDIGFNTRRIFGLGTNTWPGYTSNVSPARYGEAYYTGVTAFAKLAAKHHAYLNWVAFIGPDVSDTEAFLHWNRLVTTLQPIRNIVMLSAMNEDNVHPLPTLMRLPRPVGVLASRGSNGGAPPPNPGRNGKEPPGWPHDTWDILELHTNDALEWTRKASHNCWELDKNKPCIASENTRAPDRFNSTAQAFDTAAGCTLLNAGCTFHSWTGRESGLWTGLELALAEAWVAGAKSIPLACQAGQYFHRQQEIDEEIAGKFLRVYRRGADPACVVRIRR